MTKMRLNCERLMMSGPLPSGIRRLSVIAFEANAAIEGGLDVACLERAGKEFGGAGMEEIEGGIAGWRH